MSLLSDPNSLTIVSILLATWLVMYMIKFTPLYPVLQQLGASIEYGVLIFRTSRLNDFLNSFGAKHERIVRALSSLGVALSFYLLIIGVYTLHVNLLNYFRRPSQFAPVMPLIPGVTFSVSSLPYFFIAAATVIIPHELAHAVVASSEHIPVKSTGVFFLLFLLGAFVEPDENKLRGSRLTSRLRVFSAGSAINFVLYLLAVFLLVYMFIPYGIYVMDTLEGYPAAGVLKADDIIISLNNTSTLTLTEFKAFMDTTKPGDVINVRVIRGGKVLELTLKLAASPSNATKGFLGVYLSQYYSLSFAPDVNPSISTMIFKTLQWVELLNISVAVFNMLPIAMLDGGLLLSALLSNFIEEDKSKIIEKIATLYMVTILLLNMALSFRIPGLQYWVP